MSDAAPRPDRVDRPPGARVDATDAMIDVTSDVISDVTSDVTGDVTSDVMIDVTGDAMVDVTIDGQAFAVARGTVVAAALEIATPARGARRSVGGQRRQAFCGMGVCGECRVTIDGRAHRLGCQVVCAPGMEIRRDD